MSRIALLGATGPTGRHLLDQALERGHEVTVLVRDPERLHRPADGFDVVVGDATEASDVARAMAGASAVLTTLGSGSDRSSRIASQAASAILQAAAKTGITRAIVMSAFGVGDTLDQAGMLQRIIVGAVMKDLFADKAVADHAVRTSDLDWTLVYPVTLNDRPATGQVRAAERMKVTLASKITRADVARFMLDELDTGTWSRHTVVISGA